ncbi:MAG: flagellar basal body rod protein FlgC [Buchnera aphidicola (Meitanaphis elongallis)]
MSLLRILDIANSAITVQSQKMNVHANNLANIDSLVNRHGKLYPYIAKKVILKFDTSRNTGYGGVKIQDIVEDTTPLKTIYDPNNPISDSKGFAKISNVNLITEMVSAIATSRSYQANLEILNTAKSMIMKTLTIGQ